MHNPTAFGSITVSSVGQHVLLLVGVCFWLPSPSSTGFVRIQTLLGRCDECGPTLSLPRLRESATLFDPGPACVMGSVLVWQDSHYCHVLLVCLPFSVARVPIGSASCATHSATMIIHINVLNVFWFFPLCPAPCRFLPDNGGGSGPACATARPLVR
eukprot:382639-Pleurochrysis_carterae.AAC.1